MYETKLEEQQHQDAKEKVPSFKAGYIGLIVFGLVIISWSLLAFNLSQKQVIPEYDEDAVAYESSIFQDDAYYYYKSVIEEIADIYEETYIGGAPKDCDVVEGAIAGYVNGIGDKYGQYLNRKQTTEYFNEMGGVTVGIGVTVAYEEDGDFKGLYVTDVAEDSPAKEADIKKGDYIVSVNGKTLNDLSFDEFIDNVKGEQGAKVSIGFVSDGVSKTVDMYRQQCSISTIDYSVDNGIAYIKISHFDFPTTIEFTTVMNVLRNAGIDKYIFDVRNNSGGLVMAITAVLDHLLPEGLIVRIEDKNGVTEHKSDADEVTGDMVVLTNQNTASAAELFTLALKDYDKAISIGEKTYGKGTQITTMPLSNGGSLILTSGKYYTKDSPNIEGVGVEPDIHVPMSMNDLSILYKLPLSEDVQYQAAVHYLNNK